MLLLDLDPTTLCVVLLILALSGLWAYVAFVKSNIRQPNFDLLHEQASKKVPKNKGKRKQVILFMMGINWNCIQDRLPCKPPSLTLHFHLAFLCFKDLKTQGLPDFMHCIV